LIMEPGNIYLKLKGGEFDFKGASMEPALKEGDRVIVRPVNADDIKAGDIIVFEARVLGCHRVLGRFKKERKLYFWEKGDNQGALRPVSEDNVIGKVVYVIKNGKLNKPVFYIDKGYFFYYLLDFFVYFYVKASNLVRRSLLRGRRSVISDFCGACFWRSVKALTFMISRGTIKQ